MVNPDKQPPYSGPTGTVRGVIHVRGDTAPTLDDVLKKIPDRCGAAQRMYTRKFREGPGRTLADVLVAVTGYKGFVPELSDKFVVNARGCAFEEATIAMTFGQRLDVLNGDGETYIPQLIGGKARTAALLVAIPGGAPIKFTPPTPGQYALVDNTHDYAVANVFVLKYPTHRVTGLDGKFEIDRIPPGDVQVSAYSPAIGRTVQQKVTVPSGGAVEVNLEIPFEPSKKDAGASNAAAPK